MTEFELNRFDVARRNSGGQRAIWDEPIYETASFVAVPSLGALVPGWMLVIPRRAVLNTRSLDQFERNELNELVDRMSFEMGACFPGDIFIFEHGSEEVGSPTGCGLDQAHLHLVPLPFDLMEASLSFDDVNIQWEEPKSSVDYFSLLPSHGEYVSIWHPGSQTGLSGRMTVSQSQWIRRVIAAELGKATAWDYKSHPNYANLEATVNLFKTMTT